MAASTERPAAVAASSSCGAARRHRPSECARACGPAADRRRTSRVRAALQAPPASHHAPRQRIKAQIGRDERGRTFLHAVPASPVDRIAEGQSRPVRRFAEPVGEADEKSVEPGGPDLRPEGVGVGHRISISAGRYRACRQSVGRQRALQPRSVGWVSNPPYLRAGGAHEMKTPPGFRRGAFLCRPIGPDQATRSRGARPSKKSIRFSKTRKPIASRVSRVAEPRCGSITRLSASFRSG